MSGENTLLFIFLQELIKFAAYWCNLYAQKAQKFDYGNNDAMPVAP